MLHPLEVISVGLKRSKLETLHSLPTERGPKIRRKDPIETTDDDDDDTMRVSVVVSCLALKIVLLKLSLHVIMIDCNEQKFKTFPS